MHSGSFTARSIWTACNCSELVRSVSMYTYFIGDDVRNMIPFALMAHASCQA